MAKDPDKTTAESKRLYHLIIRDAAGEFTVGFASQDSREAALRELKKKVRSGIEPLQTATHGTWYPLDALLSVFKPVE
jgi:hypothetical protein